MIAAPYQVMPALTPDEFEALKQDIATRGVQVPVEYDEMGNVLDGHHRVQACQDLGITHWPRLVRHGMTEEEKRRHARRLNLDRRHLNQEQRRDLIASELREAPAASDRAIAAGLGVDHKTVGVVRDRLESTGEIPQLAEREGRDKRSRRVTQFVPSNDEEERGLRLSVKQMRADDQAEKKQRRDEKEAKLAAKILALPDVKAGLILSDFEWHFKVRSEATGMDRHAANHYVTAKDCNTAEEIVQRQRDRMSIAADNCVHLMWVPACFSAIGHKVMELQGFTYVSQFAWIKPGMGTGFWVRDCHELLFIGVKGKIPAPSMGEQFKSAIEAPKGAHSEKPDFQYQIAEKYFPNLPRVELNARRARAGWIQWGNEAPKAAQPA